MGVINQNEGLTIKPPPPELQDAEREIERLRARVQSLASQLADELVENQRLRSLSGPQPIADVLAMISDALHGTCTGQAANVGDGKCGLDDVELEIEAARGTTE